MNTLELRLGDKVHVPWVECETWVVIGMDGTIWFAGEWTEAQDPVWSLDHFSDVHLPEECPGYEETGDTREFNISEVRARQLHLP